MLQLHVHNISSISETTLQPSCTPWLFLFRSWYAVHDGSRAWPPCRFILLTAPLSSPHHHVPATVTLTVLLICHQHNILRPVGLVWWGIDYSEQTNILIFAFLSHMSISCQTGWTGLTRRWQQCHTIWSDDHEWLQLDHWTSLTGRWLDYSTIPLMMKRSTSNYPLFFFVYRRLVTTFN